MKKRSYFSVITIMLIVSILLTACGSSGDSSQNTTAANTGDSEKPVELSAVTLLFSTDNVFPYPIEEKLAEQANVSIKWQVEGIADWATKKGVLLASGDMPDMFFGTPLTDPDVSTGIFTDLAPYIDKTTNIKQFLSEVPEAKNFSTTKEGNIFGLPSKIALRPYSGDVFYVNKTWCEKLGIDLPKTTDDYYNMLKAFKERDPNGNGKADEIGYTGNGKVMQNPGQSVLAAGTIAAFLPSFGVVMNNDSLCMVKDGKAVFGPSTDNFKEAMIWLNKLYSEGLLDKEYFNLDFSTQAAKFRNEDYLMIGSGNGWTMQNSVGKYLDDYVLIEPLKGPGGDQYWVSDPYTYRLTANTAAISLSCKNVEAAMRFLDLCYDQYNTFQLAYGSEGIGVSKDANGNPTFLPAPEGKTDSEVKFANGHDSFAPGWTSDAFEKSITGENDMFTKYDNDQFYSKYFLADVRYPYIKWDKATLDELAILKTDINTYIDQMVVDFVINGDVDKKWSGYVDKLNKMGLARLMEIYQNGYDDYSKK